MSTQEERRRAIGRRLTEERQAIGRRLTEERQAIGRRIVEERTGQRIRDDLSRSLPPERPRKTLGAIQAKGALPVQVGVGEWRGGGEASGTGGIASPLTETDAIAREYWPAGLRSSDGLFVLPALKTLRLSDANGAEVVVQLADPEGSA